VKSRTPPQTVEIRDSSHGRLPLVSAESTLRREAAHLGDWLAAQGLDLANDHCHRDEGSRDRLYWRYGYFMALRHALELLTGAGATVH
jgi:hypothetical protein